MSRAPPLAGRPPYATDEPDSVYYDSQQSAPRRIRQKPPPDPNDRTSAYNVYDDYLEGSDVPQFNKHAALASATHPQQRRPAIPLAAPKPGYAAPIATLNLAQPPPIVTTHAYQPRQLGPQYSPHSPGFPPASPSIASPHPLQPPLTPIKPVFAAPRTRTSIKFTNERTIMRGNSEDTLIPKRRQQGDDFWRRFSMVAKVESSKPQSQKKSSWLKKTQSGTNRLSKWVWCVGILFLICVGGAVALGLWLSHNTNGNQRPLTIGGSDNMTLTSTATPTPSTHSAVGGQGAVATGTSRKVTPTLTVARRTANPNPMPTSHLPRRHVNHRITY